MLISYIFKCDIQHFLKSLGTFVNAVVVQHCSKIKIKCSKMPYLAALTCAERSQIFDLKYMSNLFHALRDGQYNITSYKGFSETFNHH